MAIDRTNQEWPDVTAYEISLDVATTNLQRAIDGYTRVANLASAVNFALRVMLRNSVVEALYETEVR